MGMSVDLELSIKNSATFVRIGTDIFGKKSLNLVICKILIKRVLLK